MNVIYYKNYKRKKELKKYVNLVYKLNKIEKEIKEARSEAELTFYQNISFRRKTKKFDKSKGGYRLALFFYEDYCLLIDFEIKQTQEKYGVTTERLFENHDEHYIEYINQNKTDEKSDSINLNKYQNLLSLNKNFSNELCLESRNFSAMIQNSRLTLLDKKSIFDKLEIAILEELSATTYHIYKSIYKIDNSIFYKKFVDNDIDIIFFITRDDNLQEIDNIISKDELLKKSVKAYPQEVFLADSEEWIENILKNSDGNIALSPEEEDILINLKQYGDKDKFPFFINGRAGSGKSTILQYLFADYLVEFLRLRRENRGLKYEPIYLTYNDRLKERAIDRVINIILANSKPNEKEELNLKEKSVIYRQIERYFKSFDTSSGYGFLQELLYLNEKVNSLEGKKKIYFEEIKDYFSLLIIKKGKKYKNYTPELVWYVIRSYIKGRGDIKKDRLVPMTPEEYRELPENLKTIKESIVEEIYEEFYFTYQNYLKDNNLYDDLDMIFEIYKRDAFNKKYSVIFCDEAQDFTKIEFDLILQLSIFLEDNIEIENFNHKDVPIVFAGDPFQTINPTGFSFKYLKALVYDSYLKRGADIKLNYKELQFNYRSNDEIIKFSNLIQVLRGVIFKNSTIKLQTEWLDNIGINSILYFNSELKKESYYQFIFPTNKEHEIPNQELFRSLDISKVDTPLDIKGLEYHTVVLYGFGDYYIKNYQDISHFIESGFEDKETSLPYEYFFNNFYVAITRAKEKIIIIDSIEAKENFWNKIDIDNLFDRTEELNLNIKKEELLTFKDGTYSDLNITEEEKNIYTTDKIKVDIFDRYDDEKNKTLIINDIEKSLKLNRKLNIVYYDIADGLKAENNKNYIEAIDKLMKASKEAQDNGELSKSQIVHLKRKAFSNLYKTVENRGIDSEICELFDIYEDEFRSLGSVVERKVNLLGYFFSEKYLKCLRYIIDEFDADREDKTLYTILFSSLKDIDNDEDELRDLINGLYSKEFITKEQIIETVKDRFSKGDNPKTLINTLKDNELVERDRTLHCKLCLEVNPYDMDCLMYLKERSQILEFIEKGKLYASDNYYKQILQYISTIDNVNKKIKLLDELNFDLVIENYLKFHNELDIDIWDYIINGTCMSANDKLAPFVKNLLLDKQSRKK